MYNLINPKNLKGFIKFRAFSIDITYHILRGFSRNLTYVVISPIAIYPRQLNLSPK